MTSDHKHSECSSAKSHSNRKCHDDRPGQVAAPPGHHPGPIGCPACGVTDASRCHDNGPLAYLITFTCYGTWLHGDNRGSVDRFHNLPGTPVVAPDRVRELLERRLMTQPHYELDQARREAVLAAIQEVCDYRRWPLLAAHVRSKHVHSVVQAAADPDRIMNDFKAYASRRLNVLGFDTRDRKRWTRHGSVRSLRTWDNVEAAIRYVVYEQGTPMALHHDPAAIHKVELQLARDRDQKH